MTPAATPGLVWWSTAAALFVIATVIARRVAIATGFVARPNKIVLSHRAPVPYLGGVALIVTLAALLLSAPLTAGAAPARDTLSRALAAVTLALLGAWDDRRPFGPAVKMLAMLAICAAYLAIADPPLRPALLIKLMVLVTLINAYNLIDVMDGLLCLLAALPAIGLLATPDLAATPLREELVLALLGLGALFVFNAPPARIYAGDAGSLPLGFLVGAWCLAAARGRPASQAAANLVGFAAIPLLELALLFSARLSRGRSPFRGSPDHYSLRLQDQAHWSKWQVLGVSAAVGACFAFAPLGVLRWPPAWLAAYAAAAVLLAAILFAALWRIPPSPER